MNSFVESEVGPLEVIAFCRDNFTLQASKPALSLEQKVNILCGNIRTMMQQPSEILYTKGGAKIIGAALKACFEDVRHQPREISEPVGLFILGSAASLGCRLR